MEESSRFLVKAEYSGLYDEDEKPYPAIKDQGLKGRKMQKLLIATLLSTWAASSVAGPRLNLLSDQGVQGVYRYCEYTGGKIYGVPAGETCPATVMEQPANGKGLGFFKSESQEGTSKLCIYRVSGQDRSIRVDTHANCPLNHEF